MSPEAASVNQDQRIVQQCNSPVSITDSTELGDSQGGLTSDPEQLDESLPSLNAIFQSQSYIRELEAKLNRSLDDYTYVQDQLLNSQSAHQREYQSRLMLQNQIHVEKQQHSDTTRRYQSLYQQHNMLLRDYQREKDTLEVLKKLIADLESVIDMYRAHFNVSIQAPSENQLNPGSVDAHLPAMKQEYDSPVADADPRRTLFNEIVPSAPTQRNNQNHYGFEIIIEPTAGHKPITAGELAPLPADPSPSSLYRPHLGKRLMPEVVPAIGELSSDTFRAVDSGMGSGNNQFTLSAVRDTPLHNGAMDNCSTYDDRNLTALTSRSYSAQSAPVWSNKSSKRSLGKDDWKQRKKTRRQNLTITTPAAIG